MLIRLRRDLIIRSKGRWDLTVLLNSVAIPFYVIAALAPMAKILVDYLGKKKVLILSFGILMSGAAICMTTDNWLLFLLGNSLVSFGCSVDIQYIYIVDEIREERRGTVRGVYDAEMQNYTYQAKKELMLRNRYYQSIIDNRIMESGMEYQELKDSYVIFICTFDPFGKGRRRYTFFNVCEEDKELYADDGRTILIFNTGGCLGDLSEEAKEFLDYVENGTISGSLSEALEEAVKDARHNKEWSVEMPLH